MGTGQRDRHRLPRMDDGSTNAVLSSGRKCHNELYRYHHQSKWLVSMLWRSLNVRQQGFGYTALKAQLYTAPNYAAQVRGNFAKPW